LRLGKRKPNTFIPTQNFSTITWLTVDGNIDECFLNYFPNIKYLNVTGLKVSPKSFENILKCDKIEKMIVQKTWLGGFFKFPALKYLTLKNIKFLSPEIFRVNNQIQTLEIENCSAVNSEVIKLIHEYCKNLKIFIMK
jgi:hypothetical protein